MRRWQKVNRTPWKMYGVLALLIFGVLVWRWSPGLDVRDGRNDRGRNGIVLGTAWIADDAWFARAQRDGDKARFRDSLIVGELARTFREHGITEIFLQLPAPTAEGALNGLDAARTEALLYECYDSRGWAQITATALPLGDVRWRRLFILDLRRLLDRHPRFRGVQLDLASIRDGDADFLALLDVLRLALAKDARLLSVATGSWSEAYFREVAKRADQLTIPLEIASSLGAKFTASRAADRISQSLAWSENKPVAFRIPADRRLRDALRSVHLGLSRQPVPANYQGVILDAEDAPNADIWSDFQARFLRPANP